MKSIAVHLDAAPRAAERLGLAQRLARRHGAQLTAVYAVLPTLMDFPLGSGEGIIAATSVMTEVDRRLREQAKATFDEAGVNGRMRWSEVRAESALNDLCRQALYHDLLVLGQEEPGNFDSGPLPRDFVPSVITETGKPTLVVPYAGHFGGQAERVVVAWKPSAEAARAATAALPWLRNARQVHVAWRRDLRDEADPLPALVDWMKLQGVNSPIQQHHLGDIEAGEALLSLAAEVGAELLAMGCYGHGRMREWVLGGASRTVLASMTLPVLMVH